MKKNYKFVIIGSKEYLARHLISLLLEKGIHPANIIPLDLHQYKEEAFIIKNEIFKIEALDEFDFNQKCIIFLCRASLLPKEKGKSNYLIDCTGILEKAPCIIPFLNKEKIFTARHKILCNPTSIAITLALTLTRLKRCGGIKNACVMALLSTSEFGNKFSKELWDQTRSFYTQEELNLSDLDYKIAFNVIPEISEKLTSRSIEQIKCLTQIPIYLTTALVPVFEGHCFFLYWVFDHKSSFNQIKACFNDNPLIEFLDETKTHTTATPIDTFLESKLYISDLKENKNLKNTYSCWIVANNLRFGKALNAVNIAFEILKAQLN